MSGGAAGLGFVSGALAGRVFPLGPRVVVGRDPRNEVAFPPDTEGVSTRHAQLSTTPDGGVDLVDLTSRGGTFVDGERVPANEPVRLRPGAVLRFGASGPLAVYDALSTLGQGEPPVTLVRDDGRGAWRVDRPAIVGRDAGCEVALDPERDTLASSRHLRVTPAFGRVVITDLGSANGTWLDGRRVTEALVRPGAVFTLGTRGPALRVASERDLPAGRRPSGSSVAAGVVAPVRLGTGSLGPAPVRAAPPPAPVPAPAPKAPAPTPTPPPTSRSGRPPAPAPIQLEAFRLDVSCGEARGRIHVFVKTEVQLGSYGALNDIMLRCFPRELENDKDALDRSESIGPEHLLLRLTPGAVALRDLGQGPTRLNGRRLAEGEELDLDALADVWLGDDVLGLQARVFRHPRLPAIEPLLGQEHKHPVECVVLERKGDGGDHLYVMLVRQASLGASDDAAIRLPVPGVAPLHALMFVKQGKVWLSQLGESPVAVGGVPLRPGTAAPLEPGVSFYIGAAKFEMHESSSEDFEPES